MNMEACDQAIRLQSYGQQHLKLILPHGCAIEDPRRGVRATTTSYNYYYHHQYYHYYYYYYYYPIAYHGSFRCP